jgi:hypothetical protein
MSEPSFDNGQVAGTHDALADLVTATKIHSDFSFDEMDQLGDDVRQRLKEGESFESIIRSMAADEVELLIADRLAAFIAIIRTAKKPILFLDCLWMASGAAMREAATIVDLAKKHGCEKQAIQQAVKRIKAQYFPERRKASNERGEDARDAMAHAYFPAAKIYKAASE